VARWLTDRPRAPGNSFGKAGASERGKPAALSRQDRLGGDAQLASRGEAGQAGSFIPRAAACTARTPLHL